MKTAVRRTVLTLSILLPALGCLFLAAPLIINSYILPGLLQNLGPVGKQASLIRLTPFSVQGFLRFEENVNPVMSLPYIKAGFSPGQLLKKRFSYVRVDHATFHLHKIDGSYRLAGFSGSGTKGKSEPSALSPLLLPLAADRLILKECSLVLHQDGSPGKRVSLSADLVLAFSPAGDQGYRLKSLSGTFFLSDMVSASGSVAVSLENRRIETELVMESDRLPVTALDLPESLLVKSEKLKASIRCALNPENLSLLQMDAEGSIGGLQLEKADIPVAGLRVEKDISFSISGTPENLEYRIGPVTAVSPIVAELELAGTASIVPSDLSTSGELNIRLLSGKSLITTPLPVQSSYQASFSKKNGWLADIDVHSSKETKLSTGTMQVAVSPFRVHAKLSSRETLKADISINTPYISLTANGEELRFEKGAISSTVTHDNNETAANLKASVFRIYLPSKELMLKDIRLDIPARYPFPAEPVKEKGAVTIKGVYLKKSLLAGLSGTLLQVKDTWKLAGDIQSGILQGAGLWFTADTTPLEQAAAFKWNLERTDISPEQLSPFVKVPENIDFNGQLSAHGTMSFKQSGLSGDATLQLEDGVIKIDGNKGLIQGVNCNVEMDRLPEIVSSPSQHCGAESITFGNMHFTDFDATFRIDGPDTVFIEKSRVGWCRGMLESTSLDLSLADKKIDTVFYCSRINFSDLLNQFGLDQAEGEGSVNGKLPVQISKAGLRFDDGFLFSTPGTGGIVKFSNTDMLRQGVGSVDAGGYLEYSMKAMEDFSYNWTKLSFNSVGEELLLTMQLDGKPRTPLPYKFRNGKILNTPESDGMQYPIRLDVNFRLPLDDLFRVGQNIKTIKENM